MVSTARPRKIGFQRFPASAALPTRTRLQVQDRFFNPRDWRTPSRRLWGGSAEPVPVRNLVDGLRDVVAAVRAGGCGTPQEASAVHALSGINIQKRILRASVSTCGRSDRSRDCPWWTSGVAALTLKSALTGKSRGTTGGGAERPLPDPSPTATAGVGSYSWVRVCCDLTEEPVGVESATHGQPPPQGLGQSRALFCQGTTRGQWA